MKIAIISDRNSKGILAFDLRDILTECAGYERRKWVAWGVECFGSSWANIFLEAPNEQVEMTYEDIEKYATEVGQTIDGTFFAIKNGVKEIPPIKSFEDCFKYSDLIIRAFDSTNFQVVTSNSIIVSKIIKKFKLVEVNVLSG